MSKYLALDLRSKYFRDAAIGKDAYTGSGGFANLISDILPNALYISAFILFLYMIFGGFMIISSSGDSKKTDEGKQALTNAIIGFVIVFTSYWIIQIIEIITGVSIVK